MDRQNESDQYGESSRKRTKEDIVPTRYKLKDMENPQDIVQHN